MPIAARLLVRAYPLHTDLGARQTGARTLHEERADTREMLKRVKGFVVSFAGEEALGQYGFGLPAPATRPRLKKSEPQQ